MITKLTSVQEWVDYYDTIKHILLPFMNTYNCHIVEKIVNARNQEKYEEMIDMIRLFWYSLPDDKFNIVTNSKEGWKEYIVLLNNALYQL